MSEKSITVTPKQIYSEGIYLQKRIETNTLNQIIETVHIYTNMAEDVLVESFYNAEEKAVLHHFCVYDTNNELHYELCYDGEGNYTDGYDFEMDDSFLCLTSTKLKNIELYQKFDLHQFLSVVKHEFNGNAH